jgi:hypothetical protein
MHSYLTFYVTVLKCNEAIFSFSFTQLLYIESVRYISGYILHKSIVISTIMNLALCFRKYHQSFNDQTGIIFM